MRLTVRQTKKLEEDCDKGSGVGEDAGGGIIIRD